jgi:hypothetical protein
MIDVRWPQQHYARTAVWAGQRFPLLQRLLARAGAGEIPPGGGHTGFVYRTARAFPVTLASSGAELPGTAAARFDIRRQANPDSSGKIDLAPYSPAASTVNAGPLTDRLAQRTTRPAGVIHVQQSRQQASRTAGEFGQTVMTLQDTPDDESHDRFPLPQPLPREWGGEIRESLATFIVTLLKPLLARYDSGRGAETRSDLFRVFAASSATRPATVHNDLTAGAASGDSLASRPAGEAAHHGQIGSLRSAVTQAAGVTPEMAERSSIAGQVDRSPSQVDRSPLQVDRPPSTGFTAEPSPLTAGSVRVRRKVLPATAAFSTRQGAAPSGKSMAHGGQPDDQPSDRVATLAAIGGPAVPGTRTPTDPQSSDRIATNLSASTADFSAMTNAGLRQRLLPDYPTPAFPAEAAAANRRAIPDARVAAKLPLAAARQTIAHAAVSATPHDRADDAQATLFRRAAGTSIRQPGDSRLPVAIPPATPGAVRNPAPTDGHRFDQAAALPAKLAAPIGPPAAASARPAIDRSATGRSEPVHTSFRRAAGASIRQTGNTRTPVATPSATPGAVRNPAPIDDHRSVDPPLAGHALAASSAAKGRGSLPFAYPTAARHAAEVNEATPDTAVTSALPVIHEKATAAATDPVSGMVWRQRIAASPSPGAGSAGILETTKTPTVAARPSNGGASSAPADSQPSLSTPTSDVPLPGETRDWEPLIAQLSRRIHRQLTIERERRGVKGWN